MSFSSLCFSSFVFGSYQKYIPFYIYSIWKTYPDSFIKIFIDKPLSKDIAEALQIIKDNQFISFEIIQIEGDILKFNQFKIKGGGGKLIRWLIDPLYFKEFNNVYIGDIDIFFLPEKISLLELHTDQMKKLKVPFSNKVRTDNKGNFTYRLTGLHFLKTKEYFKKIEPIITRLKKDKLYREAYLKDIERDEHFLYKINKEVFNFDDDVLSCAERPWHGMHLGITRGNKGIDLKVIEENSSLSLIEIKNFFTTYSKDKVFKKLQEKVFVIELEVILRKLSISRPLSWKYKGVEYRLKNKFYIILYKIKSFLK